MMRASRLLGFALVLATAATAAAQDRRFYLTKPFSMSELVPNRAAPRDNVAISVKSGGSQSLGEFSSTALPGALTAGTGEVTLFLATGQQGMTGCAEVSVTLTRVAPGGRSLIGTATVATSINPRRDAGPPIVLPVDVAGTSLEAGDQIALEIAIGNACGGGRNVALLYDSLAAASRVDFAPPAPTTTTTTIAPGGTTTTTTTTTTTSSTLPPEVECSQFPSGSFAVVECWYGILTRVVGDASTEALGGARRARRIQKRAGRIGKPIEKAEAGQRAAKRLAAGARRLSGFQRLVERLASAGKMDAPLGVELSAVAKGMSAELERLRAATP